VNPLGHLLAAHGGLAGLPAAARQTLTGREFFPGLISGPFQHGLVIVFVLAAVLSFLAALASALRGARPAPAPAAPTPAPAAPAPAPADRN
jgi:ABC-type lipoprotein release transport system permease subunit